MFVDYPESYYSVYGDYIQHLPTLKTLLNTMFLKVNEKYMIVHIGKGKCQVVFKDDQKKYNLNTEQLAQIEALLQATYQQFDQIICPYYHDLNCIKSECYHPQEAPPPEQII